MKIFWSWQSDTHGKTGRHFIKKAIETAISELKSEIELDESIRDLEIDHDRKGVSGSPDLAKTILDKIASSAVFIADVTPVGETPDGKKKILNPNVGIELGFALSELTDARILMLLNEFYGDRETLPFDLKHKAGPILYNLAPSSSNEQMRKESKQLIGVFKVAIRDCLESVSTTVEELVQAEHGEIETRAVAALYVDYDKVIADRSQYGDGKNIAFKDNTPLLYLRLIPTALSIPLKRKETKDIVYGINIRPFRDGVGSGSSWELNKQGGITFSDVKKEDGWEFSLSQVFLNREIWGIDETTLSGEKTIPSLSYEEVFEKVLKHYVEVATNLLNIKPPFIIEAGASNIDGFNMAMGSNYMDKYWGPALQSEIRSRHTLGTTDQAELDRVLLAIFEDFFDAFGHARPDNFRNFPSKDE